MSLCIIKKYIFILFLHSFTNSFLVLWAWLIFYAILVIASMLIDSYLCNILFLYPEGITQLKEKWSEYRQPRRLRRLVSLYVTARGDHVAVASGDQIIILRKDDDYQEPVGMFNSKIYVSVKINLNKCSVQSNLIHLHCITWEYGFW